MSDPNAENRMALLRLPWAPIEGMMSQDKPNRGHHRISSNCNGSMSITELAELTGIVREKLHTYAQFGVPTFRADLIAARGFGVHPSYIWEDWFESADLEPHCKWCREPVASRRDFCGPEHKTLHRTEVRRDQNRRIGWWRRLDRYRREYEEAA